MIKEKGFSLVEVLLVIALAVIIFYFSTPLALNFYHGQLVTDTRNGVADALQVARHNSILEKNDTTFGVDFTSVANNYIIYQGHSYYNGSVDQSFPIPNTIKITGLSDVVFAKTSGLPSATGTITFTDGNISKRLFILDSGIISKAD